jgi:hypothetical protein
MELTRVDRLVWRFNGFVIAVAGVASLLLMVIGSYKVVREVFGKRSVSSVVHVVEGRTQRQSFSLGRFSPIQGSPWLAARLEAEQEYQHSYYSKSGSSCRNYLFFDTRNNSSKWLLPNNSSLILTNHEILEDLSMVDREERKILGVLYEVINGDTNADGRLDFDDKKSFILYRLSDGEAVSLLDGLDMFLGLHQNSTNEVVIFFRENQRNFFTSLNVATGTLSEKKELPSAPGPAF